MTDNKKYFVTSIRTDEQGRKDSRCWGYLDTFEEAENYLLGSDYCWELAYYDYAVIEAVGPGFVDPDLNPVWYKGTAYKMDAEIDLTKVAQAFTHECGSDIFKFAIEKCSTPEWSKGVVDWGIG